jgi:ribosomal protein L12E/L44/L45/RPP1/RPP2
MPEDKWKLGDPDRRKDHERRAGLSQTSRIVGQAVVSALEAREQAREEERKKKEEEEKKKKTPEKKHSLGLIGL